MIGLDAAKRLIAFYGTKGFFEKIKETDLFKKFTGVLSVISEKRLDSYSAAAAFYIFMSFIPYSLILLSTVKYLPFSKKK